MRTQPAADPEDSLLGCSSAVVLYDLGKLNRNLVEWRHCHRFHLYAHCRWTLCWPKIVARLGLAHPGHGSGTLSPKVV
jgi:hypothetical protein